MMLNPEEIQELDSEDPGMKNPIHVMKEFTENGEDGENVQSKTSLQSNVISSMKGGVAGVAEHLHRNPVWAVSLPACPPSPGNFPSWPISQWTGEW